MRVILLRSLTLLLVLINFNLLAKEYKLGPKFPKLSEWKSNEDWKDVFKLIDEQKYQKALDTVEEELKNYSNDKDDKNWTIALITKQNLLNGLHNVEKSVNEFKSAKWPKSLSSQILLNLYYAQTLRNYYRYYSWEINKREKIVSKNKVDLKNWTKEEIFSEIQKSLLKIWSRREELGNTKTEFFKAYISEGSYPRKVRGTIRDSFTYFYVAFLKDTRFWSAKHSNDKNLLNIKKILSIKGKFASSKNLLNKDISPVHKIAAILTDLEKWHWNNDKLSALMEARYEKIRFLNDHFTKDFQRRELEQNLIGFLRDFNSDSWWSEGMYLRATIHNELKTDTAKIEARQIAVDGQKAFPSSFGGRRCQYIVDSIDLPSLSMATMKYDLKGRRSIEVKYKNWKHIYFRAYKYDFVKFLLSQNDRQIRPYNNHIAGLLKNSKPEYEWDEELKNLGDYKVHKKFFLPKIQKLGKYILVASANKSFNDKKNRVLYDFYQQTNIFLLKENRSNQVTLRVSSAKNNKPINKAKITLFKLNWKTGHKKLKDVFTNKNGVVTIDKIKGSNERILFHVTKGKDSLLDFDQMYFNKSRKNKKSVQKQSLIFTDRSIFRPNQKVQFKVLTYENHIEFNKIPKLKPKSNVDVFLYDRNNQEVDKLTLKTNEFGTASGEFLIPKGKALGYWSLRTAGFVGIQQIKVEEYKRPTFLTELKEAKNEIRLNSKASFKGESKYYFGMPVVDAKVKYTITRRAMYPYWYSWWYPHTRSGSQIVKTGETKSNDLGEYTISFTPRAPTGEASSGVNYGYNISVEVLNEGGETAKTSKHFTIGEVSVQASISLVNNFIEKKARFNISRTDLNGKAIRGKGKFQIFKLKQPKKTKVPAQQDMFFGKRKPKPSKYKTIGDSQLARWNGIDSETHILKTFKVGKQIQSGELNHDKNGNAKVDTKKLGGGAYRFLYSTVDSFGMPFETSFNFIVLKNKSKLKLPILLRSNNYSAFVGDTVKFFVHSGYENQELEFEIYHFDKKIFSKRVFSQKRKNFIKFKIKKKHLGGLAVRLYSVRDHKYLIRSLSVSIPYITKNLTINMERIRKKIYPGTKEFWKIKIKGISKKGKSVNIKQVSEVAAYMYDKSLDVFGPHRIPYLSLPSTSNYFNFSHPSYYGSSHNLYYSWFNHPSKPDLYMDRIEILNSYSIGGMGRRGGFNTPGSIGRIKAKRLGKSSGMAPQKSMMEMDIAEESLAPTEKRESKKDTSSKDQAVQPKEQIRSNFSETAFWLPHLKSNKRGDVEFSFTVPDSLTSWNVWTHAITKDLRIGSNSVLVKSIKDLMVRTYFPRFLRQGDMIELKAVINNGGQKEFKGRFHFEIKDENNLDLGKELKLDVVYQKGIEFNLKPGKSQNYSIKIRVPTNRLGRIKLKAFAKTKQFTDGELKEINILPSRIYLSQSKFITLKNKEKREVKFKDMLSKDPSLMHDSLVVKLDGQLFYSLLSALPYIKDYPYKSTEHYLNTYVSTSILNSTYKEFPSIAKMAKTLSIRKTQKEGWNKDDPNRKVSLEETPWVENSKGGDTADLLNTLDPKNVKLIKEEYLKEIIDSQSSIGGFPWFKGGPPSMYITIYVLNGFSRAAEFGDNIPKNTVKKAWKYIGSETKKMINWCISHDTCFELITFINFTLSNYKDHSLYEAYFSKEFRTKMLDYSFKHWKLHSPQSKGMLALLLNRSKRSDDSKLVFDSVLDSAKTEKDLGTYWAPEAHSWLWYNDTIESHAYALRALMEIYPKDSKRHGLVQWLFLNKKLNHWKSTRATSEVIYSVLHYLKAEKLVSASEKVKVEIGDISKTFEFNPDKYTGKDNYIVIKGKDIEPSKMSTIKFIPTTKAMSFASTTWHYSTEKIPTKAKGDLYKVLRKYYKRVKVKNQVNLLPLKEGAKVEIGDQIEVHLIINAKHESEYVHLRDPRPSGFEPENQSSNYKWDLGIVRFEEVRDSGMNFFFEKLPVGEYTLKHRIRANLAGSFRTHPATLQSIYAPEFNAFSSGATIKVMSGEELKNE